MFTEILEEFVEEVKGKESDWFDQLKEGFSLEEVEREILDMVNDLSSRLTGSLVVQMALLCPSFAVAHEVLSLRGISVDVKTIRRLCGILGELGLENRSSVSLKPGESVAGKVVVIGIDGGRLRLRQKKRGRKASGLERQGYNTPWREPRLFTILWNGDIPGLKAAVTHMARGRARKKMLKGMGYFETHASRMQYQSFKANNIPQGSGCVESAIRRVINLRLKAPGTFWTPAMAEYFLFLRSQLLCGRWLVFMTNVARRTRGKWSSIQVTTDNFVPVPKHCTSNHSNTKVAA